VAKILITSGPTRQYLDPVRYISNASSGRMGAALADAALRLGHEVVIVSGPVPTEYPPAAKLIPVLTTDEMLAACQKWFPECDGAIGAAAPCDYMPRLVETHKIAKTGQPLTLQLIETPDVVATLGQIKTGHQWVVGFALETSDRRFRATVKLEKKHCDMIVSNGPIAINSDQNDVELLDADGNVVACVKGTKKEVAQALLSQIDARLIRQTDIDGPLARDGDS
jgi:phosphopantothenoylcysteine decarboxylase/phosphopantothenate--cysteine ligase